MLKREVVQLALAGQDVPYTPWQFGFTCEAQQRLQLHFQGQDLNAILQPHLHTYGSGIGFFQPLGNDLYQDVFNVVWDRSVDKDIGVVKHLVLPEPCLAGYTFPDPQNPCFFTGLDTAADDDCFRVFAIGFSLYERAWTLRGMENLMIDFLDHPEFVHELLSRITELNLAVVEQALKYDIDAVYFGDDWGQQNGLQMGPQLWHEFIYPQLRRLYARVKDADKKVMIHSCGKVQELFDDLIAIGLDCFNPFQPEVMDVHQLLDRYHKRLAFHGGLSTQQTLPYGSAEQVRTESCALLKHGRQGGYIFAPAHAVEGDVPLDNMLAFIDAATSQVRC